MSEHDFIYCATAAKPKGLVGRDFIACSSEFVGPMHEAYRRHKATAKSRGKLHPVIRLQYPQQRLGVLGIHVRMKRNAEYQSHRRRAGRVV